MSGALTIRIEQPDQPEIARLIEARDVLSAALYPPESNHGRDVAALRQPEVVFLVARRGHSAVGCGALVRLADGTGEVKSMFVDEAARGTGAGRALLEAVEAEARAAGLTLLRLETGIDSTAARQLYEGAGYRCIGPFGGYVEDPWSVFMEKRLAGAESR